MFRDFVKLEFVIDTIELLLIVKVSLRDTFLNETCSAGISVVEALGVAVNLFLETFLCGRSSSDCTVRSVDDKSIAKISSTVFAYFLFILRIFPSLRIRPTFSQTYYINIFNHILNLQKIKEMFSS